jgi:hypothetical protein
MSHPLSGIRVVEFRVILVKGKIKHGKDSLTLENDERSVRPLGKVSTQKKRTYSGPGLCVKRA